MTDYFKYLFNSRTPIDSCIININTKLAHFDKLRERIKLHLGQAMMYPGCHCL